MNVLEVVNLRKEYPRFTLNNVCFRVGEGRIVGLIGRNGAGKSTTLKGILGLISAEGELNFFGKARAEQDNKIKQLIGYVGGGFRYYPLKTLAAIKNAVKGCFAEWDEEKYQALLKTFGLDESKKVKELSDGMKVKFALALAVSHGAKLLVLDEPTSGLDPLSREEFCDIILSLVKNEDVSVLFSTHITSDIMRIADDIVYLSDGEVVAAEPLSALMGRYLLAKFQTQDAAEKSGAIGIKEVKEGFEGLLKRGTQVECTHLEEATLDSIIIHLERKKQGIRI